MLQGEARITQPGVPPIVIAGFALSLISIGRLVTMLEQSYVHRLSELQLGLLLIVHIVGAVLSGVGFVETRRREGRALASVGIVLNIATAFALLMLFR